MLRWKQIGNPSYPGRVKTVKSIGQYSFYFSKSYIHCKKCICFITSKGYRSCDDSVWLVESGYSVWGHQNDLHVITLTEHSETEVRSGSQKWRIETPSLKEYEGEKTTQQTTKETKQTIGQFHGTFQVFKWYFNRWLIQSDDWQQFNNWKK